MSKLTIKNNHPSDEIVLVVIDDKSLLDIGRWPWKRDYYVEIFDYFENYTNAKLVAYDGLIVTPDLEHPESDKRFFKKVGDFKKLTASIIFLNSDFEKNIDIDYYDKLLKSKSNIKIIDRTLKKSPIPYKSFTVLQEDYFKNIGSLGAANTLEDYDGCTRRLSQLAKYSDTLYPSVGLILYSKYKNINEYILYDNYLISSDNSLKIPIDIFDSDIFSSIYYYNTPDNIYSHKKYSASDIINSYRAIKKNKEPIIDSSTFDGKVIFIGANAQAQAISDIKRTPVSESFSGLEIQATNFNNLIENNFYKPANPIHGLMICLAVFALIFAITNLCSILPALILSIFIMIFYVLFSYFMYENKIAIDVILPELFVIIGIACSYTYKYLLEDNQKTKIQKAMGKYLSYNVMENVVKNIDNIELGGKRADITVLFADIRNFTSISESMDPGHVSNILNEYFSAMVPIIEWYGGTLNKFMGDAMLAIFGESETSEHNHALSAVKCGYEMLRKVKILQEKWIDEGKPRIEIGIGISSGEAFIGNIGSKDRLEYTVIGDTVNTASRIENYNKIYKTNFLISESTYERVKEYIDVITIKNVVIRGKANKINLYEVIRFID